MEQTGFQNNLTGGEENQSSPANYRQKKTAMYIASGVAVLYLLAFGFISHLRENSLVEYSSYATALILTLNLFFFHRIANYHVAVHIGVATAGAFLYALFFIGGQNEAVYLWMYAFPLVATYFLGSQKGVSVSLVMALFIMISLATPSLALPVSGLTTMFKVRFLLSYLIVVLFSYLFESSSEAGHISLANKNKQLDVKLNQLRRIEKDLQTKRASLEKEVTQRTVELYKANQQLRAELEDRKNIETQLAQEKNLLSTIINNLPDHIFVKNSRYEYVAVNDPLWQSMGLSSADEIVGKNDYELFPEFRAFKFIRDDETVRRTRQPLTNMKEKVIHQNGQEKWYLTTKVPVFDKDGSLYQIVGISRDITDLNEKEEALRKSERKYKETSMVLEALFDAIPDVLGILDTHFEVHRYNKAGYEFMQTTAEEVEGKRCYQLLGKPGVCKDCATALAIESGKPARIEKFVEKKNVWLDARAYPILNDEGEVIRVIEHLRDITDYKKALDDLLASEERFKALFDFAPDAYYLSDLDGRILDGNRAAIALLGYDRDILGKNLYQSGIVSRDQRAMAVRILKMNRMGLATGPDEFLLRRKDGTELVIEVSTYPIRLQEQELVLGIARDVSDRKRAEKTLKVSEERFRLISENTSDLIAIISFVKDPEFHYASPSHKKILGWAPEELIGQECAQFIHPEDIKDISPVLDGFLRQKERARQAGEKLDFTQVLEYRFKDKKGRWHYIESTINNIKDDLLIVSRDISERKQQQEAIKASLREKEILLQEVHHRVKNNLQIISSLLYLQSKNIQAPELLDQFRDSQNRIKSMALIHEKLYQSNDFANINFKDYVKSLSNNLLQTYRNNGSKIQLDLQINDVLLTIDKAIPCGLIINELLSNSLKYAFPNGQDGTICVQLEETNGSSDSKYNYHLVIKDNGCGIPEDFDFSQAKSLGLKLVQSLTAQLDGELKIERENGTVFKIDFMA